MTTKRLEPFLHHHDVQTGAATCVAAQLLALVAVIQGLGVGD